AGVADELLLATAPPAGAVVELEAGELGFGGGTGEGFLAARALWLVRVVVFEGVLFSDAAGCSAGAAVPPVSGGAASTGGCAGGSAAFVSGSGAVTGGA